MTETFFADRATLMSPRTAKYVEAMIRADFDYNRWLKEVRAEEAKAKQTPATGALGRLAPARIGVPIKTFDDRLLRPNAALPLTAKAILVRALRRSHRRAKSQAPKARLRRWLEKIRGAWDDFQSSRRRDSVYQFLTSVFAIVTHFKVRRRTKRLLRHAFEFANLSVDKNAEPFSAVIRCTCGDGADGKAISKWVRALRYVARCKAPDIGLQTFMKEAGGINACADRYTKHFGRGHRRKQHASV